MNKFATLLCLYFLATAAKAQVVQVKNNTLNASQKNQMVQVMAGALKNQKMPSLVAAATKGNKVIWVQSLGYADYEKKIKVNPNFHMYRWASVSKVATDVMIKAMAQKGVLDLDKPISNYYSHTQPKYLKRCFTPSNLKKYFDCRVKYGTSPVNNIRGSCFDSKTLGEFETSKGYLAWVSDKKKDSGQVVYKTKDKKDKCRVNYKITNAPLQNKQGQVTLRNLLNHTSGVQHYSHLGRSSVPPTSRTANRTAINTRRVKKQSQMAWAIPYFFPKYPLLTEPGKTRTYTTFGYNLAGRILEKQTAMRYEDLLELYADKMGAKSIQADYLGVPSQRGYSRTFVYKRENGKFIKNNYKTDNSYKLAGGGVMSTITDLARFCVGISNDDYFLNNGWGAYAHDGAHNQQSKARLHLYTNVDDVPHCLVLMTNTGHGNINLEKVRLDLAKKLRSFGIWKKGK